MHSSLTSAEKREYSYASFPGKGCLAHLKIQYAYVYHSRSIRSGDKRRLFMPTRPRFQGIGTFHLLYDFAMLFIFGITIGANQSLLNNIGEFGIQAAILAICGVLGSLVASFIAYKLFIKKGGLNEK